MRFLKEKYEGLQEIDELSPRLRKFLSNPEVQEAFQKSDFSALYRELRKTDSYDIVGNFTRLLNNLNIDPLNYLDSIPNGFLTCTSIKNIDIPDHITSIGDSAFYDCTGLTSITIPDSVTSIGNYTFKGCNNLKNITIPNNVTSIGDKIFENCTGLTNVTIPDSVTNIGEEAFRGCSGLTSIVIPDSVTIIGDWVFSGCSGLANVTIGNRVTRIGYMAFEGCRNLTYIKYMGTIDQWNKIHISSDWNGLSPIKTIHCLDGDINL